MSDNTGVHASHCCKQHGCKYSDEDCPVESGAVAQMYACETCHRSIEECREMAGALRIEHPEREDAKTAADALDRLAVVLDAEYRALAKQSNAALDGADLASIPVGECNPTAPAAGD